MCQKVFTIVFLFINLLINSSYGYRYALFDVNIFTPCTEVGCGENKPKHTACNLVPSARCKEFEKLTMPHEMKVQALMGINGIRNKIAGLWRISNMNILHWDRYLSMMARRYLLYCQIALDECNFILDPVKYPVGQTFTYIDIPPKPNTWHVSPIRSWYTEISAAEPEITSFKDLKGTNFKFRNFTQLIWPTAEFVGCAAAEMYGGYLMTCYFSPKLSLNNSEQNFKLGKACTNCDTERPTCSRTFMNLCGLDLALRDSEGSSVRIKLMLSLMPLCLLFVIPMRFYILM